MMIMNSDWFQLSPIPANAMSGTYDLTLVALSYVIAVLASYVALDLVGRLRAEKESQAKLYWLFGGSFAMGAGIWSMHFIGMLAFVMTMPMGYDLSWTISSLIVAILASGFALFLLRDKNRKSSYLIVGGVILGLGIASMHYMGMEGMASYTSIHYLPGLFFLSIGIAIFAAEAALWLALKSNQGSSNRQFYLKIISALIMGVAICGMHYAGMAAAVFTPLQHAHVPTETIRPDLLAFYVAGITALIISLALTVSMYYKHMVNAVQNEKEFLNAMLDNLEDGIIACDESGKITVLNDALQKVINLPYMNYSHINLSDFFELYEINNEEPITKEELPLFRALKGERIHAIELVMKFKNGIVRDVVVDGQPIINSDGNKLGAVIAIHDVTEIMKSEKMKTEFVSVVSHELRTPLTSIRGSLGLLLGGTVGTFSEKAEKFLEIANKNCERLLLLINDILDMEKIQAGKMKFELVLVDIRKIINESILINKMYGEKFGVTIELKEPDSNVNVYVDPDRLLQVLANLISNAAKFSPQGGVISIEIKVNSERHAVRVSVSDNGSGIPAEFQSRIFQKFSQADSSDTRGKGGTGLGLSISKAIIEKMGGEIGFTSTPNDVTMFYIHLPIFTATNELAENISSDLPGATKKLLICEDDEDQARYISLLLDSAGFASDVAYTVDQARKFLEKNNYHAILLDLILPDVDGITFIREIRKNDKTRELPVIVLSVVTKTGQELLSGDAVLVLDWLDKPVNFEKLMNAISRIKPSAADKLPKILHVEDDIDMQHVISSLLEKEANITPVSTIKETMQRIGHENFDLVILDLLLPDGNSSDLLPIFAKFKLPIIVYSAFDLDKQFAKYVTQSLVKSKISNDELLATIKKLLEKNEDGQYVK